LIQGAISAGVAHLIGDRVFAAPAIEALSSLMEVELARFHKAHPRETGMPRETLRGRLARGTDAGLFDAILAGLVTRGVARGSDRVALTSHVPLVESGEMRLRQAVEDRLRSAALTPPDAATLAPLVHASPADVAQAVQALVRDGRLVRIGDLVFHRDPLAVLKGEVAGLRSGQPAGARVTLDVGAFKTRHGLTRKHAIPLLEWLDRERVTRRVGDERIVI
jgi:selenocysteine-specific elongation factor